MPAIQIARRPHDDGSKRLMLYERIVQSAGRRREGKTYDAADVTQVRCILGRATHLVDWVERANCERRKHAIVLRRFCAVVFTT